MQHNDYIVKTCKSLRIPIIDPSRKYWLVRANGGIYFDEFILDGYIGLLWNKIDNESYLKLSVDAFKEKVAVLYPEEKMPGNIVGQILKFAYEIKAGDIVLIPSEGSHHIAFCKVLEDDPYFFTEDIDDFQRTINETFEESESEELVPCRIRKKIKVLRVFKRYEVEIFIQPLLHSHHTVSSANGYSNFIDRMLNDFYIKDEFVHLIFNVKRKTDIPAIDLINGLSGLLGLSDIYKNDIDSNFNKSEIDIKLNLHSPGPIELFTDVISAGIIIGLAASTLMGGTHKIKVGDFFEYESNSDGLLEKIIKFIEQHHQHSQSHSELTIDKEEIKKIITEAMVASEPLKLGDRVNNLDFEEE